MKKIAMVFLLSLLLFTGGCGENLKDTKIVLTTGFSDNEIFKIEDETCTLPEAMVFLVNTKNRYENVYGSEIWQIRSQNQSLEENVKETVLAQLAQLKTMNLLAETHEITLDEEEESKVRQAAEEYFSSLNEKEKEVMQVEKADIEVLYREYALAEKVYQDIIKDINPEISDDEARTITVEYIFFKTSVMDGTGKKIDYSEEEKKEVLDKAKEALALAKSEDEEVDFEKLILEYSDDDAGTLSFGKGDMEAEFETAAFNLATGEISNIVETSKGYYIVKCMNTFNREETDANKYKIVEQRREEVFGEEYEKFVKALTRDLNTELWKKLELPHDEEVTTASFFETIEKYFTS